jgi:hypothetical protein
LPIKAQKNWVLGCVLAVKVWMGEYCADDYKLWAVTPHLMKRFPNKGTQCWYSHAGKHHYEQAEMRRELTLKSEYFIAH